MSVKILPLETIAKRAEKNHYDLEDLPWDGGLDFTKFFFPEHLTPLFHTESYAELNDEQVLAYNQLYGQAVNEQFIFLEDRFLIQFLGNMLPKHRHDLPADLVAALDNFVVEEIKHTEMFRKLARLSNADRYTDNDFFFLRLGRAEGAMLDFMAKRPDFFVFWCILGVAFEEKTIDYFRHYQRHEKERPDRPLDPLFFKVHQAHMMDEVRHVQIDHHLVKHFYENRGTFVRTINYKLISRTLRAYTRPKRTNMRIVDELVRVRPELADRGEVMKDQIRALAWSKAWQEISYSRKNVPQTFALFDEFPELHALSRDLLCYEPEPTT